MAQDDVERLIGRLLTDDHFRARVAQNLSLTCHEGGYKLSDEEQRLVMELDMHDLSSFSGTLNGEIKRFGSPVSPLPEINSKNKPVSVES